MSRTIRSADSTTPPVKPESTALPNSVVRATRRPRAAAPAFDELPDGAYVRQPQLIPSPLPWSSATLWRKCKRGEFVAATKLSERVTAWNVGAVRRWLEAQAAK